jgi:hypothetical protein
LNYTNCAANELPIIAPAHSAEQMWGDIRETPPFLIKGVNDG